MVETYNVLLVDDDYSVFVLLRELLESEFAQNITLAYAADGLEALDAIASEDYFLVILDFHMPNMNGLECLCELQKREIKCPPVIFLSGASDDRTVAISSYQYGAVDYLSKPVESDILLGKIQAFLSLHRQQLLIEQGYEKIRQRYQEQQGFLDFSSEGILGFSIQGYITYINRAAETLLTARSDHLIGMSLSAVFAPGMTHEQWMTCDFMSGMLQGQNEHRDDYQFYRQNGHCFEVEYTSSVIFDGDRVSAGMINFQDISERKIVESRLLELTRYDQLTSLMNRTTFQQYLEDMVAQPGLREFCLMVIDIDKFKSVNESLGPKFGDKLLVSIANRLVEMQRPGELLARTGADEFAVLMVDKVDKQAITQRAEDIIEALSLPYFIDGKQIIATVGLGIACYPAHGVLADELLSAADTAVYMAKTSNQVAYAFFSACAQDSIKHNYEIALCLRRANFDREFRLVFQPKYYLESGALAGAEALLRWDSPVLGAVPPADFIPVAEGMGLIRDITDWCLKRAASLSAYWNQDLQTTMPISIAINASAVDLMQNRFAFNVLDVIYQQKLNPAWLEVELTETAIMQDPLACIDQLSQLSQHRIKLAIDDFGTGYSSLNYLKKLPIDYLKIDGSFIKDIGVDPGDEKIVDAIIHLAHSFDLKVIAECIETQQQCDFLKNLGCDIGQGYLLSKPLEAEAFGSLLFTLK
jgi:diguanylate cyclase (GGDEF)-like protein/PAS domain S-box-containing protein